tara:strand:+ start:684 stop:2141 length:1458 start_codon:yes stop_codon:yes gene_type:complete
VIQQKEKYTLTNWELVSVNPSEKNWTWKDLFCLWGNGIQTLIGFSLIASFYLTYNLNSGVVFFGSIIAALLVYFFANLIGRPSQKHGLPFPVILRMSMGVSGAKYIAMLRGLVGLFMFGVQTFFISKSIGYIIRIFLHTYYSSFLDKELFLIFFMGMDIIDGFSFLITLLIQYWLFSRGQSQNRSFINFSAMFVYFGLILFLIIIISENFNDVLNNLKMSLNFENFFAKKNIGPLLTVTGSLFAYFSIVILNFGDFSRYVKNESEMKKGNFGLIINSIIFSFLAITLVIGSDIILTKKMIEVNQLLTNPNDIIGKLDNKFLTVVAIIFLFFASSSTNLIANYIPSQNSLLNFLPKNLNLKTSGFLIIFIGFFVGLFWLPILSQIGILSLVDTIGAFFGPIFGIIIADYYLIKEKKINNKDIYLSNNTGVYYFTNGWQIKAIYALIIGFIFSASTIWNPFFNFLQSFSWLIGALISWITYYLLASD